MDTDEILEPVVQQTAIVILDRLTEELEKQSHGWLGVEKNTAGMQAQIPFLCALKGEIKPLCESLIKADGKR